jgi:hypothetical protein
VHYGDPAPTQGDRHDIHYSYLLWSFLNARGGGHVRALLREGQVVQPCDVDPILMDAFNSAGNVDGTVLRALRPHRRRRHAALRLDGLGARRRTTATARSRTPACSTAPR